MDPYNNNNNNNIQQNKYKRNDNIKTFKQTNSMIRKLPSISNMLISEQKANKKISGIETPKHFKNVEETNSNGKLLVTGREQVLSSPPFSPSTIQPLNTYLSAPSAPHERTYSLETLMNDAKNTERLNLILETEILELQKIKQAISRDIIFLKEKYINNIEQNVVSTEEDGMSKSLRNLQKVSLELHELVTNLLNVNRERCVTKSQPITLISPSQTKNVKESTTVVLNQPQTTLLPPLESPRMAQRLTPFRFPDNKSYFLTKNEDDYKFRRNIIPEEESLNKIFPITNIEQNRQDKTPILTKNNPPLQTPTIVKHSNLTSICDTFFTEPKMIFKNSFNNSRKHFTIFPKNHNAKSIIITPVLRNKKRNMSLKENRENVDNIFNLSLKNEQKLVTLTPKSSRGENKILPGVSHAENTTTVDIPYTVERKKTGPSTKNFTSKKKPPVGITKALKATKNQIMGKYIKQNNERENHESNETYLQPWGAVTVEKPFENKGSSKQVQEGKRKKTNKRLEKEEESNKKCFHCQSSKTSEWRTGPYGSENICNACGLFYRKIVSKFGEKGGNLLMKYRQQVCPTNRRVPPYIEIPEEYMLKFSKEAGFDGFPL